MRDADASLTILIRSRNAGHMHLGLRSNSVRASPTPSRSGAPTAPSQTAMVLECSQASNTGGNVRRRGAAMRLVARSRRRRVRVPIKTGSLTGLLSARSLFSILSYGSVGSILSFGSVLSMGSVGSILSIGSAGSILSIGSSGSILSIGSAGSILSIGSAGSGPRLDSEASGPDEGG